MDAHLEYLFSYLQEEFTGQPEVQVRLVPKTGLKRAPDLEQNYDPETHTLHTQEGVVVRASGGDYFFPTEWVRFKQFAEVSRLVNRIRERTGR